MRPVESDAASVASTEHERVRAAYRTRPSADPRYSWFNAGHLFTMQRRERATLRLLRHHRLHALSGKRILDIGCGEGFWLREFVKWGATPSQMHGIDLLEWRIPVARHRGPSHLNLVCGSGDQLPYADSTFDLIFQSTVFTSILSDDVRRCVAREMIRVTRPGGVILWYDYFVNNPRNPDVRAVKLKEVRELFAGCSIHLERTTLAPPLARRIAPVSWGAAALLEMIPLLRTHLIGVIRPHR